MIYAIVDTAQSTVTFARAGHELPLFVRRDPAHGLARADYVASEGMALGLVPDEIFVPAISDGVEPFLRGDALVLYTDGVTETPNDDGKEFSGARLADVARMLHHRPAHEVNDHVMEALQRFSGGGHQRDDLTLVTVRRTAG
jgi:sigma-B regulation protein RsbU (phosphoserine phosphatase)